MSREGGLVGKCVLTRYRGGNSVAQHMRGHNTAAIFHLEWKRLCGMIVLCGTTQSDEMMLFAPSRRCCIAYERRHI